MTPAPGVISDGAAPIHRPAVASQGRLLLHPTALPGSPTCGGLGASARQWIQALARHGIAVWQVLPLAPRMARDRPTALHPALPSIPGCSMRRISWMRGFVARGCCGAAWCWHHPSQARFSACPGASGRPRSRPATVLVAARPCATSRLSNLAKRSSPLAGGSCGLHGAA